MLRPDQMIRVILLIALMSINTLAVPAKLHAANLPDHTSYAITVGDQLTINIFGEEELSGLYSVQPNGFIKMPLIGMVRADGLSPAALEDVLTQRYAQGYLITPDIRVETLHYQSIYILGEVKSPGQYTFEPNLTILNAVALAGGYTYRAKQDTAHLTRRPAHDAGITEGLDDDSDNDDDTVSVSTKLKPGDIIHIRERLF